MEEGRRKDGVLGRLWAGCHCKCKFTLGSKLVMDDEMSLS